MSLYARLAALLVIVLAVAGAWWKLDRMLAKADQQGYDRAIAEMTAKALKEQQAKDQEGRRRLEIQQRNQDAQDAELAAAKAAADRATTAADRVREQAATAARDWAARLSDSPTSEDLQAASAALGVCTDLLRRADERAGVLARFADASRAAGLKCERDYDSLTK